MAKTRNNEIERQKEKLTRQDQCFIITPIGDENSEIRRHIEGIIDAVIKPALENQYEIVVAHRISTPGSITKQIIEAIYNSKLVIANLTNCNPNVMYELALRHGIGKPVIMIAEAGTKLPSDVMMQRTIFYRNDAMGVLKLRDDLKDAANKIDFSTSSGLVFETLGEISHDAAMLKNVAEKNSDSKEPLEYIMRRLDRIEGALKNQSFEVGRERMVESGFVAECTGVPSDIPGDLHAEIFDEINDEINKRDGLLTYFDITENTVRIRVLHRDRSDWGMFAGLIHNILQDKGFDFNLLRRG